MKRKGKFSVVFKGLCGFLAVLTAVFCVLVRFPQCFSDDDTAVLTAAAFTLSDGTVLAQTDETKTVGETEPQTVSTEVKTDKSTKTETEQPASRNWDDYYNTYASHEGEEKYTVTEKHYTGYGTQYGNFYVQNKTDYDLNIGQMLKEPLGFEMKDTKDIQVLIMHTHTCESYLDADEGYFFESYYPRSTNNLFNVTQVGDAIENSLKEQGIGLVHDKTIHDYRKL